MAMGSGEWLEKALHDLCGKIENGLSLDSDLISGLVSFCELAPPLDAADYLMNIVGAETGHNVIQEYLARRGHIDPSSSIQDSSSSNSNIQIHNKSPVKEEILATKKTSNSKEPVTQNTENQTENKASSSNKPKKKKGGKSISLSEAARGSVIFQQGKPCSCQARRHNLVSNCLSCGKIVCEQEGEGPCSYCGALVLREGSTYAGLTLTDFDVPLSREEAEAEAYAERLVDYDRNSAARTKVIDDQSDYYEIEGNSWLSNQEKEAIKKKRVEEEAAAEAKKSKVIITFDLVGRKVVLNKDEASELELDFSILRPPPPLEERDLNRIKPNPTVRVQPVFIDTGLSNRPAKGKQNARLNTNGFCLEITGRVQPDDRQLKYMMDGGTKDESVGASGFGQGREGDDYECSLDFN